ncbi:MAG: hypothetical protein Q8M29_09950 [Bacteroidota bacterium]|nr:hypothetical protein [Bacteroidota bacterium]
MKKLIIFMFLIATTPSFAQNDSARMYKGNVNHIIVLNPNGESLIKFPKKKRTYNEFVGNYAIEYGFKLAEGWRRDSCNGGYGKEMGDNPYIDFIKCQFIKTDYGSNFVYFYYKRGKRYSGKIKEKFNLLGGSRQEITFRARCRNGKLQGKGTLTISETKEIVAECFFENGELVG